VPLSRLAARSLWSVLVLVVAARSLAVQPSERLLPATTKGFISTHDVDEVRKKFNETQLGELVADPIMKPFIEDFKQQIGQKLERAGKKLGIKWDDMEGVYGGEVTLALTQPDPKDKMSHATVLIVDITGKHEEVAELLKKINANQTANKAKRSAAKEGAIEITIYTQPVKQGEKSAETSYHFIAGDQLIASDDWKTIQAIVHRLDGKAQDSLAGVKAFNYTLEQCSKAASGSRHQVRWFIEPFGYAEASRAAQGGRKKRGTDLLKILQGQGFTAVQGVGGHIFFATEDVEVLHRTFVYAPPVQRPAGDKNADKYNLAMRMLNFPNSNHPDDLEAQNWTLPDVASYLTFNWTMKEAFDHSETLVDAIAGDKGVFKEIWVSLKNDPNGPQIDIYKGLVNHLGTRATLLSDVTIPVNVKSERLMALIEIHDPKTVAATLEKAFKKDPQAKERNFRGQTIWEITQDEPLAEETELMIEGTGFVSTNEAPKEAAQEEEDTKLPNMAMTVYLDHLVVSTHVDFIQELIANQGNAKNLGTMDDYQRVRKSLVTLGSKNDSFRFFSRTDESYRATYELLKQGKLPEAETMLARMLNTVLGPKEEGEIRKQEIDGSKLPEFELVKKYLGPGGLFAQSDDNGWWFVGCLLKKQ
jgi:hypothetical protein